MASLRAIALLAVVAASLNCSRGKAPEPPAALDGEPAPARSEPAAVSTRPFLLEPHDAPAPDAPSPLLVLLHGYGASADGLALALGLAPRARSHGFAYAVPEGTPDPRGMRFWNATPACCNFLGADVDDVAYISSLIEDVKRRRNIDPARVFVLGHSNGGFMALRLACELSDRIAGVASIAGAAGDDASRCRPREPVVVLQIHGDRDWHVPYEGGRVLRRSSGGTHPSAQETNARWGQYNGCSEQPENGNDIDLEPEIPGAETTVTRFTGCRGGAAELWTVRGGDHFVAQRPAAFDAIYEFLMAHPRPASPEKP